MDANNTVTAFPTKLAFPETYDYRFDTADRSIVISGDTNPTPDTIDAGHGCDVLVHEDPHCFFCSCQHESLMLAIRNARQYESLVECIERAIGPSGSKP